LHLAAQTLFISRLEKPRAKLLMHLNGRADDLPGDIIFDEYPAACCGDGQETVLRKAAYFACIW